MSITYLLNGFTSNDLHFENIVAVFIITIKKFIEKITQ